MSLSVHVYGIKAPDEKWQAMKKIWDACIEANIQIPQEVLVYFDYEDPDPLGVVIDLKNNKDISALIPLGEDPWQTNGFIVDITKLPPDIKWIKFENSF
ncbi:hypothetical protein D3C72_1012510 [compost metagenome]